MSESTNLERVLQFYRNTLTKIDPRRVAAVVTSDGHNYDVAIAVFTDNQLNQIQITLAARESSVSVENAAAKFMSNYLNNGPIYNAVKDATILDFGGKQMNTLKCGCTGCKSCGKPEECCQKPFLTEVRNDKALCSGCANVI